MILHQAKKTKDLKQLRITTSKKNLQNYRRNYKNVLVSSSEEDDEDSSRVNNSAMFKENSDLPIKKRKLEAERQKVLQHKPSIEKGMIINIVYYN